MRVIEIACSVHAALSNDSAQGIFTCVSTLECVCQLEQKEMESHTHLKLCMENNAQKQQLYATANQGI